MQTNKRAFEKMHSIHCRYVGCMTVSFAHIYMVHHLKFFFQLVLISWMVTLTSCLIRQIISFILPPNEYACVYAWTTLGSGPAIDLQNMPILAKKKHLFRWSSFWSWRVCKQTKLSHLGHRKPLRIHWKADAPKTSYCLVRISVQRHNWVIFLRKWARSGRYSQWRSLSGHVERIFVHKNQRGGYWQHLVSTGRRYVPHSMFCTLFLKIALSVSQSWCRLATWELRFDTVGLLFVGCRQR